MQPLARALPRDSPNASESRKNQSAGVEGAERASEGLQQCSGTGTGGKQDETADEAIGHLERAASAQALRADCRFNFKTLQRDLVLEGLDDISRSYSTSSTGIAMRHHAQRAVNIRRSMQRPAIGPSLLHHGIALCDNQEQKEQGDGSVTRRLDGFSSAYNRYVLASRTVDAGQGLGSECSKRASTMRGHMHTLECILPLLPPTHAANIARALNQLRTHVFAACQCDNEGDTL